MPSSTMQVAVLTRLFLSCMKLLGWRQMCFDSYHTLGLVYSKLEDYERATDFYMMAAHLNPKCSSLWELLYTWSKERGDIEKASYCLSKAITADPKDITLRSKHALLYVELRDYQKAAVAYEQVHHLCCENVDALKAAAKFYQKCRQVERSVRILEDYLKSQPDEANASVVDLLAAIFMETKAHDRALQHIEHAQMVNSGKELPLNLKIKAGICHVNIGNMEMAQHPDATPRRSAVKHATNRRSTPRHHCTHASPDLALSLPTHGQPSSLLQTRCHRRRYLFLGSCCLRGTICWSQ